MPAGTINFSNTTPAAPSGKQLVTFQNDGGASTVNMSAYVPIGLVASQLFEDVVAISGTTGTLAHTPVALFGIYRNGQRLRGAGASPDFTLSGTALTLNFTPGGSDEIVAVYCY